MSISSKISSRTFNRYQPNERISSERSNNRCSNFELVPISNPAPDSILIPQPTSHPVRRAPIWHKGLFIWDLEILVQTPSHQAFPLEIYRTIDPTRHDNNEYLDHMTSTSEFPDPIAVLSYPSAALVGVSSNQMLKSLVFRTEMLETGRK